MSDEPAADEPLVHVDEDPEQHIGDEQPDPWGQDGRNFDWATSDSPPVEDGA